MKYLLLSWNTERKEATGATELCLTLLQIIRVASGQINGVADSGVLLNYDIAISD